MTTKQPALAEGAADDDGPLCVPAADWTADEERRAKRK